MSNPPSTPKAAPPPVCSSTYTGRVYAPNGPPGGSGGDDYYDSVDELIDRCADHGEPLPGELFTVTTRPPSPPNAETFIRETILEDSYEDAFDTVTQAKLDEMREFLAKWCATCGVETWHGTTTLIELSPAHLARAAALPPPTVAEDPAKDPFPEF